MCDSLTDKNKTKAGNRTLLWESPDVGNTEDIKWAITNMLKESREF